MFILCENNDQTLSNKSHGPMHYTIDVTCVINGETHEIYNLL